MQPLPHQLTKSEEVFDMLKRKKYCLLQGEVRCVDETTEFLTPNGWKYISEYEPGDLVCEWYEDGTTKLIEPLEYHKYPNSELYTLQTPIIDMCVTANHDIVYETSRGHIRKKRFDEAVKLHSLRIPAFYKSPESNGLDISIELLRVLIMHSADGSIIDRTTMSSKMAINVKKEKKQMYCEFLLKEANIPYEIYKSSEGYKRYVYTPPKCINFKSLEPLWGLNKKQMKLLFYDLLFWDGSIYVRNDTKQTVKKFTGNKQDCTIVQHIFSCVTEKQVVMHKDKRTYVNNDIYEVNILQGKYRLLQKKNQTEITKHIGTSYCFTTNSGMWLMRRNNKVIPTGNSGKSLTALLAIAKSRTIKSILILTKKAAIKGIEKFINDPELTKYWEHQSHYVTNYEALGRFVTRTKSKSGKTIKPVEEPQFKLNPDDYDFIICDEHHVLGKVGKPSKRYKLLKIFAGDKPWLAMSGTSFVETPNQIYYATSFSTKTPFPHKSFYTFFKEYGIPNPIQISRTEFRETYKLAQPQLLQYINTFSVYMTQKDAGIDESLQSNIVLHKVELSNFTKVLYNKLQTDRVIPIGDTLLVADSIMKLNTSLYMLEKGVAKIDDDYYEVGNTETIDYIKNNFTITKDSVILSAFIGERDLLRKHFPQATVESVISKAEGVDYSHADVFILTSLTFSGAKYTQVVERTVNVNNNHIVPVNILVSDNAISHDVYEAVTNKRNFNISNYKQNKL